MEMPGYDISISSKLMFFSLLRTAFVAMNTILLINRLSLFRYAAA